MLNYLALSIFFCTSLVTLVFPDILRCTATEKLIYMPYPQTVIYRSGHIISYMHNDNPKYQLSDSDRKKKTYKMRFGYYVKILNSILKLNEIKQNKLIFLTLTFPLLVKHKDANKIFCNFIDNFKKNYGLHAYVGVAEHQTKNKKYEKNIHYHLLADFAYIAIGEINRIWLVSINNYYTGRHKDFEAQTAKNAVRLPPKRKENWPIIEQDIQQLAKYMAKYLSKGLGTYYDTKFFFASANCRITSGVKINPMHYQNIIQSTQTWNKVYEHNSITQIPVQVATKIIRGIENKT